MNIASDLTGLIGNTPLVRLDRFVAAAGDTAVGTDLPDLQRGTVLAKLELANPGSSVKDRIALAMIEAAEADGRLKPGGTLVEPTSGNTGIGLAWIAAVRGYRVILVMPESMSIERRKVLQFLGAEIVLTPANEGMGGAIRKARLLLGHIPDSIMPQQFMNPANPDVHYRTTGPEIWEASGGKVDILVAGVGTGGTVSGTGRFLKERNPALKVFAVEPDSSPVLSGGQGGPHLIQGIGAGFVPDNYDPSVVDEVLRVPSSLAIKAGKELARTEGIMGGISSGANVHAARELALRPEYRGKTIVTVICDTAERYVSTLLFYED